MFFKHIKRFILIFLAIFLLLSCNSEIKEIIPDTELKITVLDDKKNPIPGAVVGVFTTESSYRNANKKFTLDGAIQIDTADENGLVEFYFKDVTQEPFYWLAGYKIDSSTYSNARIMHDNDITGFRILRPLNPASVTYGRIVLTPAEALLSFYADGSSNAALPIRLKLGNDTLPRIVSPLTSTINTHFETGLTTVKVRRGIYPYQFINRDGCTYLSQVEIKGGEQNLFVKSNTCTSGRVKFWTANTNRALLPITITIDINNILGNLTTSINEEPECGSVHSFTYFLDQGTYTYRATSFQGNCLWTGNFEIKSNECTPIQLDRCF